MSPSRSHHYGEYVANSAYLPPAYCYGAMKLTVAPTTVPSRTHRKVMRGLATKRAAVGQQRINSARGQERTTVDACDNSNDSGLGFDHHVDYAIGAKTALRFLDQNQQSAVKRKKLEIKLESDDPNENFNFPESVNRGKRTDNIDSRLVERETESIGNTVNMPRSSAVGSRTQAVPTRRMSSSVSLNTQLMGMSRDGKTHLQILCQPEQQHRARYQTEGSRGAVKDRTGNGFPVVKLVGYNKPATLQVFIGTDVGRVAPHMFYQACRVSGKNSTPCVERKIDGTVVIEVDFDPAKDMVITCDCVGILKERNVDVEHRFPDQSGARNKKKSTRCRMVFRTTITHHDGSTEILQATSHPIVCTQPPGVPEICKKSLVACPCTGGMELFILGKNFLKDTRVVFQHAENADTPWEESVLPDKEFLQQTHLVCVVPPYCKLDIKEPVMVRLHVVSSGKTSEPHSFTYTPALQQPAVADCTSGRISMVQNPVPQVDTEMARVFARSALVPSVSLMLPPNPSPSSSSKSQQESASVSGDVRPILMWQSQSLLQSPETKKHESKAMPPPELVPLVSRRPSSSLHLIVPDPEPSVSPTRLKTEVVSEDSNSQSSPDEAKGMDLRMKSTASISPMPASETASLNMFQHFVSSNNATPLPSQSGQSVEKYLSHLEHTNKPATSGIEPPTFRFPGQQPIRAAASVHFDGGPQKQMNFVRNMPVQNIYGSTDATLSHQQAKSQFIVPQHKSVFSDNSLTVNCGADSVLMGGSVQEPQQTARIERSSSSTLLYMPENTSAGAMINSTQHSQENLPKNSNTMNIPGILRNLQDSSLLSPSLSSSTASPLLGEPLQRVNQVAPALLAGSQDARLDALVSSAIDDRVCQQIQTSETEKLDALVNSAAVRHMMGNTTNSSVMAGTQEIPATDSTQPSSTAPVKKMALELPMSSDDVLRRFDVVPLNSAPQVEGSRQMPNNTFTDHIITSGDAAVHALSAGEVQAGKLTPPSNKTVLYPSSDQNSPIATKTILLNNSTAHSNENQMLPSSPTHSSPMAVKKIALSSGVMQDNSPSIISVIPEPSSSSSSSESHIMSTSVNPTDILNPPNERPLMIPSTSPIAMKSIIIEPMHTISAEPHMRNVASTSPIAMKTMILESAAAALSRDSHLDAPANTSIAVKSMILESSDSHMSAPTSSPVAVKNMLLESTPVLTTESQLSNTNSSSPVALKTMILNENIVPTAGLNTHSLGTPQPHVSKGKNMDVILEAQSAAPLLQAPNQASTIIANENLQATTQPQFSTASSSQNMVTGAPAPNAPTGLIKQMLMGMSTEEKIKKDENGATASQEYKMPEMGLFSASRVMKATEVTQQEKKQPENSQQEKPQVVATPATSAACGQPKKAEEGMLPQELTQMSENDLISYINPSTFDQV